MDMHAEREIDLLFIEDSQRDFRLVEMQLEKQGLKARLRQAANAAEIAAALKEGGWDVVLADYKVPGVAWEKSLAALQAGCPEVPVILVSGTVGEETAVDMLKQGIADFVLKSNLTRLVPAIERSLREAELRRSRAAAEAALRESEERLQLALQGTSDGIWDWEPRTGRMFFSSGWKAMLGYALAELQSSYAVWTSLLHPDDAMPAAERLNAILASSEDRFELEYRLRHKNGYYIAVLSRGIVLRDARGEPWRLVGSHTDVTARRSQEQSMRLLLAAAPDAVVVSDAEGRIMLVNDQCERFFGYRRDELLGHPVEMLLPERYRSAHIEHRRHFWAQPRTRAMGKGLSLWGRRRDGSEFPVEVSLSPLNLPLGRVTYAAVRDVSEQRQAAEALQRYANELEAVKARLEDEVEAHRQTEAELRQANADLQQANTDLEEFVFVASHDLQTPLRSVHSFSNLLARKCQGKLDPEADEFMNHILRGSRHMSDVLHEFVHFFKVRHELSVPEVPVDSALLLEAAVSRLGLQLAECGGEVRHDALPQVVADPEQLGVLFDNLVSNGIKFRRPGIPPKVQVSAEDKGDEWVFCVRDNGIGIAPKYQERIFRLFQRLHSRHEIPGTGMGLALSKRIIELHGGRIWVESAEGEGAAFFFALPKQISQEAVGIREIIEAQPAAVAEMRQARIVIADDHPVERDYMRTVLGYGGHEVLEAVDGAQALALVRKERPDLLITDMLMPVMDGYALMQAINADPEIASTPVIFCSATFRQPEIRLLASAVGTARYLTKPVDPVMILDTVQEVLQSAAPVPVPKLPSAEVERAYLRVLNDKLLQKTDELEQEIAARGRAEAEIIRARDELELRVREGTRALQAEAIERQRVEDELRRSNTDLEQFAKVTSHDLQASLRTISNFAQRLADNCRGRLDEEADRFVTLMVEGVERMRTIISDILAYSSVQGSRGGPVELADGDAAFRRTLANLKEAIAETGAHITSDPLPPVAVPAGQLNHLFQNLVSNALEYRGSDPLQIHVSVSAEGKDWRFCVRDNGIGIAPVHQERIFGMFQRLHTRQAPPGTGIGLALCKKIVELHGGRIWVESAPGEGAVFCFTLPSGQGAEPASTPGAESCSSMSQR